MKFKRAALVRLGPERAVAVKNALMHAAFAQRPRPVAVKTTALDDGPYACEIRFGYPRRAP